MPDPFPSVHWAAWQCEATFLPGDTLPPESEGRLYAALAFVFYGDKIVLADIQGRGWCIPSGRIEPGETLDQALRREVWEETGGALHPRHQRLLGCYRLTSEEKGVRYCPVFVAEALGFGPLPDGSESNGILFAAPEEVADLYFTWDPLMAAVFAHAAEVRAARFGGVSLEGPLG